MTVLQGVLTSAGLVAVLMGLIWRMFVHFDAKNEQAHAERRSEAHRVALESIARDVSFLAGRQAERASGGVASGRDARRVQDSACSPPEARDDGVDNLKDVRLWLPTSGTEMSDGTLLKHEHAPWLPFAREQSITSRASCAAVVMLVVSLAFSVTSAFAQFSDTSSSGSSVLQNPVPKEDWPMRGRTPDGWGYSPLDQINRNNVTQLQIVWSRDLGPSFRQETPNSRQGTSPRVSDGIMYLFTLESVIQPEGAIQPVQIIQAIDAATGDIRWRYWLIREPNDSNDFSLVIIREAHHRTSDTSESSYVVALTANGEPVFALDAVTGGHVWPTTDDREFGAVDVANSPLGSCPTQFRANSREARTYSPLTEYCMTTNGGTVQAISAETSTVAWEYEQETAMGRLAATGGGLVFGGDHGGRFRAFDHETGEVIWETDLESPITHSPITYAVDGRQYVAIYTDSGFLSAFALSGDACPLSVSHSMSVPLRLYRDSPRPYWFFPFILSGVERVGSIRLDEPVVICEAVHRSTWSERSLWLRIVAGSKRGWVNVGPYDDLEDFLRH